MTLTRSGFIGTICAALGLNTSKFPSDDARLDAVATSLGLDKPRLPSGTALEDGPVRYIHLAELRSDEYQFPIDNHIVKREELSRFEPLPVEVPEAPPAIGRNPGICWTTKSSFDEVRLSELLTFARKLGFVIQEISVQRGRTAYGMASITFGQYIDPRLPKDYWDTHDRYTGQDLKA